LTVAELASLRTESLFDLETPPGGYSWWYADGLSHDGEFGFTLIAFVGSVFSPYYAWSGRSDPRNHCAINIALYGRRAQRWAMTERGRGDLKIDPASIVIGPSRLDWDGEHLTAQIAEHGAPVPYPIRGWIRLRPRGLNETVFDLDPQGDHAWRPIAPFADVEVAFSAPRLRWRGTGYWDMNRGRAPLEQGFRYWDWSRVQAPDGRTAILYNTERRDGGKDNLALLFQPDGTYTTFAPPVLHQLKPTPIFRIQRLTRSRGDRPVRLGRTLEDAPFYSRSVIESNVLGSRAAGIHESFDGDRLSNLLVKMMLPARMPRRPIAR
jgi:carotenoid 1,2-hydratase